MKTSHLSPTIRDLDEIQDCLDSIIALSDLLGCVGSSIELGKLHDQTVANVATLIEHEALKISRILKKDLDG